MAETEHNWQSETEMTSVEANRFNLEASRQFQNAEKLGPAAVDQNDNVRRVRPLPVEPVWSAASYAPTPSLSEAMITSLENYDEHDAALVQARHAFSVATETLKKIAAAREPLSRDTSKTLEQKLLLMATHSEKAQDNCGRAFDKAYKSLNQAVTEIERQLNAPLEMTTHSVLCQEIRAFVRSLPKDEREKFVNDAVQRGDMQVLNSVMSVPSYLSGISEERKALWLRQYREKADPIAVARLSVYRKAIERVTANGPLILIEFEKAQGGKNKDIRRLRGQVEASDKALAGLSGE